VYKKTVRGTAVAADVEKNRGEERSKEAWWNISVTDIAIRCMRTLPSS
jgi:hypothetical protein